MLREEINHTSLKQKISSLETKLRDQRETMEDNPGEVTADMEAHTKALEKEVRAMRVEIDVSSQRRDEKAVRGTKNALVEKVSPAAATADTDVPTPRAVKDASRLISEKTNDPILTTNTSRFKKGNLVEGNFGGEGNWFPGVILAENSDGTYDIHYDDGDEEKHVNEKLIRKFSNSASTATQFSVGCKIEARYRAQETWYPGKIVLNRGDGSYDILYDDGEKELRVRGELVRLLNSIDNTGVGGNPTVDRTNDRVDDAGYSNEDFESDDPPVLNAGSSIASTLSDSATAPKKIEMQQQLSSSPPPAKNATSQSHRKNDDDDDDDYRDDYGDEGFEDED
jgi:hypothetical protein